MQKIGIHTSIDSSGGCFSHAEQFQKSLKKLLEYTDLILLDLKHIDRKKHIKLTGMANDHIFEFANFYRIEKYLFGFAMSLFLLLPTMLKTCKSLANLLGPLENVEKVEILPYHKLGVYKWEALGHKYPLADVNPPTEENVEHAKHILQAV